MASGYVVIDIDNVAPEITATLNSGWPTTVTPEVLLLVSATDDLYGQQDLKYMKVWGDVDTSFNVDISTSSGASRWFPFSRKMTVLLSAGSGTKTINVIVMDSVGNSSASASTSVELKQPSTPEVTITVPPRRNRFSQVSGYDVVTLSWRADRAFDEYVVKVVDNLSDTYEKGTALSGTNVAGSGSFAGGSTITTTISTTAVMTVSPSASRKIIKVFVRSGSVWSA